VTLTVDGKRLTIAQELKLHADMEHEEQLALDTMAEWLAANNNAVRSDQLRMASRAVDKLYAEMRQRGHRGFVVTERDGEMFIEPLAALPECWRERA
jgi:hypothetical protein